MDPGHDDALRRAQETIEAQAAEIERLRRRADEDAFVSELREALNVVATAGAIASPVPHGRLLELIVATAADIIRARKGSLFLLDEDTQELVFEVALGEDPDQIKKFRVPLGHGVAGLVALSGQPMAISEAQRDTRHAADIAEQTGYLPENLVCVPLHYNDRVIGVLELLDKEGAPSFSADDIEALGLFANQAAVAIEQSHAHRTLAALLDDALASLAGIPDDERERLRRGATAFAAGLEDEPLRREALALARLVHEIASEGEDELNACQAILQSFAEYLRERQRPFRELGTLGR